MKNRTIQSDMNQRNAMMRWVIAAVLFFAATWSYTPQAEAKSEYEVIYTGIRSGGCWYDDTHFVIVKGQQPAPGQEFVVEGLYYLDPSKPKGLRRIDLSPIDPNLQKHIRDVTCQEETILFHVLTTDKKRNTLYSLKVGQPPTILADKIEGFVVPQLVNIRNRYMLSFSPTRGGRDVQNSQSSEEARKDCQFSYVQDGYRVHCLRGDRGTKQMWVVSSGFLVKYIWDETIRVNKDGQYQWVPNSEPPLKLPDGTEFKQGYLIRDLENRIVREIPMKQDPYQVVNFQLDPQGMYLYGACYKVGDHGDRHYTQGGRICRFLLDGSNRKWQEVVSVQKSPKDPFSLHQLDVNSHGDVVMSERGHRLVASLWKYSAQSQQVDKLVHVSFPGEIGAPRVSPSGKWVSAIRNGQLIFIEQKGTKP